MKKLFAFYQQKLVGVLVKGNNGISFTYSKSWLKDAGNFALSVNLPLQEMPFEHAESFFANMLPEGETRFLLCKSLGVSEKNDFGLLVELGGEIAGAITLQTHSEPPIERALVRDLNHDELEELIAQAMQVPYKTIDPKMRLSLAGAQNKLPIIYVSGQFSLPLSSDVPTTHIIKFANPHFTDLVMNEYTVMRLAQAVGLNVPEVAVLTIDGIDHLVVTRYDRLQTSAGWERLHQEDFCQALGVLHHNKYESEGGPSLAQCVSLIREHSTQPAADILQLVRWVLFNLIIGNHDAHGKNIAFLYSPKCVLAPFYDLISTQCYPGLSRKLSMKVGGENRINWLQVRHFERLSAEIGVKHILIKKEFRRLVQAIDENVDLVNEFEPLKQVINNNLKYLESRLR